MAQQSNSTAADTSSRSQQQDLNNSRRILVGDNISVLFVGSEDLVQKYVDDFNKRVNEKVFNMFNSCNGCGLNATTLPYKDKNHAKESVFINGQKIDEKAKKEILNDIFGCKEEKSTNDQHNNIQYIEEIMSYVTTLEALVDALTPGYFPTRDFWQMRKVICPRWFDALREFDKNQDPKE